MGRLRKVYSRLARPQTAVGLLVVACLMGGLMVSPNIIRPTQASQVPVIHPRAIEHVRSASIAVPVDCAKVACMALTFDDGPNPLVTPQILDILDRHGAKATFFVIGSRVPGNEAILQRMNRSGYEIGNHTWSHRDLSGMSPQEIEDDIALAQTAITAAGVPAPRLFRAPYGAIDPMVRNHVPYTIVSWNIDPEDWRAKKPEKIVEHVLTYARPGAIVDLHDIHQITADSLDPILTNLEQTYHLVTVSELLSLPPGQPGVFYGR